MTAHSCRPATCTNGKCRATGECIEVEVARARKKPALDSLLDGITEANRHPEFVVSPPLVPTITLDKHCLVHCGNRCTCGKQTRLGRTDHFFHGELATPSAVPTRTIVAFTGRAGSGKSTAAAHLVKRHGYQRVRFAEPLKAMLAALGCTPGQIDGSEKETPCELLGDKTPRHAMQTLGTEWGRDLIAPDLWIRAWQAAVARVPTGVPVVVDDLRFPNEAAAIRAAGGVIVAIGRPGAGGSAAGHVSEQHDLPCDQTLRNIADEQYLRDQVDILAMDLSW